MERIKSFLFFVLIINKHIKENMKYILLILGIILSSLGLSYIIIYLNLLVMGYTFLDYLKYIFLKIECISFIIGYTLLIFLLKKGKK